MEVFGFGVAIVDDQLRLGATPLGKPWPLGHWAIFRAVISRMKNGVFFFRRTNRWMVFYGIFRFYVFFE